jgi:hypothetical protein
MTMMMLAMTLLSVLVFVADPRLRLLWGWGEAVLNCARSEVIVNENGMVSDIEISCSGSYTNK